MDIKSKYRYIFNDLFSSDNGLFAYTLHSRYHLQPSEAVAFMDQYEKEGLITGISIKRGLKCGKFGRKIRNFFFFGRHNIVSFQ